MTTATADAEHGAVIADARQRLAELRTAAKALWPDRDHGECLSELVTVIDQIRACETTIRDAQH